MPVAQRFLPSFRERPLQIVLLMFAAVLWMAGGSSRADDVGQVIVRVAAWMALIATILMTPRGALFRRGRPVFIFLVLAACLVAAQLVPLPPGLWAQLPGRAIFGPADSFGGAATWRPLAIVPSDAQNALASLVVPFAVFGLVVGGQIRDATLVRLLLAVVIGAMAVGLLQFAGALSYNPLVGRSDDVAGIFANRNHFALLMACGFLLAPVWAFLDGRSPGWRGPCVMALFPLLTVAILGSGSRAGMLTALVAIAWALFIVRQPLKRLLTTAPRWVSPMLVLGAILIPAGVILLSTSTGRALSISRALALDPSEDMRHRGLSTVLAMVREYLPFGSGFGGFDTVFRLHEPFELLKPTYFNRAHDDFLEVVLDAGIPGLLLGLAALGWWAWSSWRAWRTDGGSKIMLPRLGSGIIFLIMLSSIVDYPARTPVMMAVIVAAALLLGAARPEHRGSPLRAARPTL